MRFAMLVQMLQNAILKSDKITYIYIYIYTNVSARVRAVRPLILRRAAFADICSAAKSLPQACSVPPGLEIAAPGLLGAAWARNRCCRPARRRLCTRNRFHQACSVPSERRNQCHQACSVPSERVKSIASKQESGTARQSRFEDARHCYTLLCIT